MYCYNTKQGVDAGNGQSFDLDHWEFSEDDNTIDITVITDDKKEIGITSIFLDDYPEDHNWSTTTIEKLIYSLNFTWDEN